MANPPARLVNFISEHEVAEIRKRKGERDDAESGIPDRPLFEILKQNKDKQQAEFNERFKHQPPKALDEDETEFLERLEMHKREQEMQLANEEAQELLNFQAAVANRKITFQPEDSKLTLHKEVAQSPQKDKKTTTLKPLPVLIKIKPHPKKAKLEKDITDVDEKHHSNLESASSLHSNDSPSKVPLTQGLVAYGTDSDED